MVSALRSGGCRFDVFFIDYLNAFDNCNHVRLWDRLVRKGVDKDGNVVDAFLRVRLHLNNGKTKWLNGKSSSLVVKFQQDMVHKLV